MKKTMPHRTCYDILSVPPNASGAVIRAAWRSQVMRLHPDHRPEDRIRSEAQLREINQAYAVLKDPARRAAYDLTLRAKPAISLAPVKRTKAPAPRWKKTALTLREIFWPLAPVEASHGR
ncbi:MAG: J domain-containing protein [Rhodospirillales bacterium]|nr:J domain-containing protein [Rhodospirillales bacterium]